MRSQFKRQLKRAFPILDDPTFRFLVEARVFRPAARARHWLRGGGTTAPRMALERYAVDGAETFFGYHDLVPLHADGVRLLAHVVRSGRAGAGEPSEAEVGFFRRGAPDGFQPIGRTSTWCWQMGARLQWFPDPASESVLYNAWHEGRPAALVRGLDGAPVKVLERPVYALSARARAAVSLNFARLGVLRPGYGYEGAGDPRLDEGAPDDDGLWHVPTDGGKTQLLLSLRDAARLDPDPSMSGAIHYFNHVSFNPIGSRILLFHLWIPDRRRPHQWRVRALIMNADGTGLSVFLCAPFLSHYAWIDPERVVMTCEPGGQPRGYYVIRDGVGVTGLANEDLPALDGHPMLAPNGLLVTDTYADRFGDQHLLVGSLQGPVREIGRLRAHPAYRQAVRCDLHPRWDPSGRVVVVDSTHEGRRAIYAAPIDLAVERAAAPPPFSVGPPSPAAVRPTRS